MTWVYVASRASIPARGAMWRSLRHGGWNICSSWIDEDGSGQTPDMSQLWERIEREIRISDALILYAEPGDMPLKGAFVEAGMAIAQGKPVFAVLPQIDNPVKVIGSWLLHPLVTFKATVGEALHSANAL